MEQNENQNVAPVDTTNAAAPETNTSSSTTSEEKEGVGALAGIIIIVLILALGGYYFWQKTTGKKTDVKVESTYEEASSVAPTADELLVQSSSDAVVDIQADLDTTNLTNLDAELDAIEGDLNLEI